MTYLTPIALNLPILGPFFQVRMERGAKFSLQLMRVQSRVDVKSSCLGKGSSITVTRCWDVNRKKVVFLLTSVLLSCNLKTKVLADVHMADMCGLKPVFMEPVTSQRGWLKWSQLQSCCENVSVSHQITEAYRKYVTTYMVCDVLAWAAAQWPDGQPRSDKDQSHTRLCAVACCPETRGSPSVPPCWYAAAHASPWD